MRFSRTRRLICLSGSLAALIVAQPGWAQDDATTTANAAVADDVMPGEIVVTAQKREQSLNAVPMSVTAVTGLKLVEQGINSTADLVKLVPGLTFTQSQVGTPVYTLRGVGFYESSLAASPAVSVYVDQIPLPFASMTAGSTLDLERVEVLKGPQGTLFGQNATGGAINYVAAKPTSTFKAGFDASYGRFGSTDLSAFVSGPITDTLEARFAVRTEQGGTWQKSYTRDESLGDTDRLAARLLVDWNPIPDLKISLNVNGWRDKSDVQAPQLIGITPYNPAGVYPGIANAQLAPHKARAADWSPGWPMDRDDDFYQVSLRADYELGDFATLSSISSWQRFTTDAYQDLDATPAEALDSYTPGRIRSFYQEVRAAGSTDRTRWIIGANYERDRVVDNQILSTRELSTNQIIPGLPILAKSGSRNTQEITTYAGFANLEYDVTDAVTLQGGLRYTRNERKFDGCSFDADGTTYLSFIELTKLFTGAAPINPLLPGSCLTFDPTFQPGNVIDELNQENLSWRAGVDWKIGGGAHIYANVSRGYKAGGFPTVPASSFTGLEPITQETLLAYEAGFKAPLFNRTMQLNGAVFYYDYKNKQVRGRILDPVFGLLEKLVNVPKSHLYGAEISANWTPFRGLAANVSGTWLKSKIDDFEGYNGVGQFGDYAGSSFAFTPEWQVVADVQYNWPISDGYEALVGANLNYNSETNSTFGSPDLLSINARTLIDLRAGLSTTDGQWRLLFWGRNVTNKYYWNTTFQGDTAWRMAAKPATYGATLSFRY